MPIYCYRCASCGKEAERVHPIGQQPDKHSCECGSVLRQVLGVGLYIAAAATPNKRHAVHATNQRDIRWGHDMPAYKDARDAGLQPRTIDGCSQAMRGVDDQVDIDYRLKGKRKKELKTKIVETAEMLTGEPPVRQVS